MTIVDTLWGNPRPPARPHTVPLHYAPSRQNSYKGNGQRCVVHTSCKSNVKWEETLGERGTGLLTTGVPPFEAPL